MSYRCIVVLGMHRSGTSLAARAVNVLGVQLGDNLWGPRAKDNPTGFWEDRDVVAINESLLERLGLSWHSLSLPDSAAWKSSAVEDLKRRAGDLIRGRMARFPGWGFKDPRTVRALSFWKSVFVELGVEPWYVLTVRNPLNVAGSLARRDDLPLLHSQLLWLDHVLEGLDETEGARRVLLDYDALVDDPAGQMQRLADFLGEAVDAKANARVAEFCREFVADELRHNRAPPQAPEAGDRVTAVLQTLYAELRTAALHPGGEFDLRAQIGDAARALREWRPFLEGMDEAKRDREAAVKAQRDRDWRIGDLESRNRGLLEDKAGLENMVRERGAQLQAFYARIAELEARRTELESMVREHGARLSELNAMLVEVSAHRADAEREIARIKRHWYWRVARFIIR